MNNNLNKILFANFIKKELDLKITCEHKFHAVRKWRFDYAIIEHKIAIEVEGGVWSNGRHTRGAGFVKDIEKYNTATSMGWRIIRVVPSELLTLNTVEFIKTIINNTD